MSFRAAVLEAASMRASLVHAVPFSRAIPRAIPRRSPNTAASLLLRYYATNQRSPPLPRQSSWKNRPTAWAEVKLNDEQKRQFARGEVTGDRPSNSIRSSNPERSVDAETGEHNRDADRIENSRADSQPSPTVSQSRTARPSSQAEDNGSQEEFEGPKSAKGNSAPKSPPKQGPPSSKPLPDLRQGIPSTFAEEFNKASENKYARQFEEHNPRTVEEAEKQEKLAHEHEQEERAGSGRGGGDLPKSAYETSTDKRRNKVANYSYLTMAFFGVIGAVFLGRDWQTDEEARRHADIPSGWGFRPFWERIQARINDSLGYYTEPTFPKLLPDTDGMAPPYTLVLSLEDLMIHTEWTRQHGWRTAKRPGLDYFLRYLSQYYEIVMFTSVPMANADPVFRKLDPYRNFLIWPLFREATRYHKGEYIKDLAYLNRDPSKVVFLDTKPGHVQANPENAIILPAWSGDPKDTDLVSYVPFLEHLAAMAVPDVRKAIASFEGKHIPTEYARREAIAREQFNKQRAEEQGKKSRRAVGSSFASMLGIKPSPPMGAMILGDDGSTVGEGYEKGMMLTDQIRERGRKQYEFIENMIRTEGANMMKQLEEDEKKMMEEQMEEQRKNMKGGVAGWLGSLLKKE